MHHCKNVGDLFLRFRAVFWCDGERNALVIAIDDCGFARIHSLHVFQDVRVECQLQFVFLIELA